MMEHHHAAHPSGRTCTSFFTKVSRIPPIRAVLLCPKIPSLKLFAGCWEVIEAGGFQAGGCIKSDQGRWGSRQHNPMSKVNIRRKGGGWWQWFVWSSPSGSSHGNLTPHTPNKPLFLVALKYLVIVTRFMSPLYRRCCRGTRCSVPEGPLQGLHTPQKGR